MLVLKIGGLKKRQNLMQSMDKTLLSMIKGENETAQSFRGNLSSILLDNKMVRKKVLAQWQLNKDGEEDSD